MLQYCGGNTTVTISVRTNVVRVVLVVGDVDDDDPSKATISSTNSHTVCKGSDNSCGHSE